MKIVEKNIVGIWEDKEAISVLIDECDEASFWNLALEFGKDERFAKAEGVADHDFGDLDISTVSAKSKDELAKKLGVMKKRGIDSIEFSYKFDDRYWKITLYNAENVVAETFASKETSKEVLGIVESAVKSFKRYGK